MFKILTLIAVLIIISEQKQNIQSIIAGKEVNYTFYHLHRYPQRKGYGISLSLKQQCEDIENCKLKMEQRMIEMKQIFQPHQLYLNLTGKAESYDKVSQAEWSLQIKVGQNYDSFAFALDELANLTQNNHTFVWQIFRYRILEIDNENQKNRARDEATLKSKHICDNLHYSFKQLSYFEQEVDNSTKKQVIIGDYMELAEQIEDNKYEFDETYFKCQIVCQRKSEVTLEEIQKKINMKDKKTKLKKSQKKDKNKKNKKINISKYQ